MASSTAESRTGVHAPEPIIIVHVTYEVTALGIYQVFFKVKVDRSTRIGAAAAETLTELTAVVKTETSSERKSFFFPEDDDDFPDGWKVVHSLPFIVNSAGKVEFSLLKVAGDFPIVFGGFEFTHCGESGENAAAKEEVNNGSQSNQGNEE